MATLKTDICNFALAAIKAGRIEDFLTDKQPAAFYCRRYWDQSLRETLEEHTWSFAIARAPLQIVSDTDFSNESAYAYAYTLPGDVVTLKDPYDLSTGIDLKTVPWEREGDYLYSDYTPLGIKYVSFLDRPEKFSALFREALAYNLASKLALPLTDANDQQAFQTMIALYQDRVGKAGRHDGAHSRMKRQSRKKWTDRN